MLIENAFKFFPVLETERLVLRQLQLKDAPQIYSYFSLDKVTEFYDLETFTSEEQAIHLIDRLLLRYSSGKQIRWGITLKGSDNIIGTCGFHAIERDHYKVEIGYELHPDYWRKGIMSEVINIVVDYAFSTMGINRVEAFYDPMNIASRRALEKNGFQYEGVLRKRFFEKGKFMDAAIAAIIKEG